MFGRSYLRIKAQNQNRFSATEFHACKISFVAKWIGANFGRTLGSSSVSPRLSLVICLSLGPFNLYPRLISSCRSLYSDCLSSICISPSISLPVCLSPAFYLSPLYLSVSLYVCPISSRLSLFFSIPSIPAVRLCYSKIPQNSPSTSRR